MFRYVLGIIVVLFALTKILENSVFLNNVFGNVLGNVLGNVYEGYIPANASIVKDDYNNNASLSKLTSTVKKALMDATGTTSGGEGDWYILRGFTVANSTILNKVGAADITYSPETILDINNKGKTVPWEYISQLQINNGKFKRRGTAPTQGKLRTFNALTTTEKNKIKKNRIFVIESAMMPDIIKNSTKPGEALYLYSPGSTVSPITNTLWIPTVKGKLVTIMPKNNGLVFIHKNDIKNVIVMKKDPQANNVINKNLNYDKLLTDWLVTTSYSSPQVQFSPFRAASGTDVQAGAILGLLQDKIDKALKTSSILFTELSKKVSDAKDIVAVQAAIKTFIETKITGQTVTYVPATKPTQIIITGSSTSISAGRRTTLIGEINTDATTGSIAAAIPAAIPAAAKTSTIPFASLGQKVRGAKDIVAVQTAIKTFIEEKLKAQKVTVTYDATKPTKIIITSATSIVGTRITSLITEINTDATSATGSIGKAIVAAAAAAVPATGGAIKQATTAITNLDIQLGLAAKAITTAAAAIHPVVASATDGGFLDTKTHALPAVVTAAKSAKTVLKALLAKKNPAATTAKLLLAITAVTGKTTAIETLLADETKAMADGFVRRFTDSITVDGPNPKTKLAIKLASTAANTALQAAFAKALTDASVWDKSKYTNIFNITQTKAVHNANNINYSYKIDFKPAAKATVALKATLKTQITTNIKTAIKKELMEPHIIPPSAVKITGAIYTQLVKLIGVAVTSTGVINSFNEKAFNAVSLGYPAGATAAARNAKKITSIKNAIIKVNKNSIKSKVAASFKNIKIPPIITEVIMSTVHTSASIAPTLKCMLLMDSPEDKVTVDQVVAQLQIGLNKYFIVQIIAQSQKGGTIAAVMGSYKSMASGSIVDTSAPGVGADGKTTQLDLSPYVLKSSIPPCAHKGDVESPFATDEFYSNFESCYQSYRPVGIGNQKDFLECLGFDDAYKATKPSVPFVSSAATGKAATKKPDNVFEDMGDFVKGNLVYIVIGASVVISAMIVADKYKGKGNVSVEDI